MVTSVQALPQFLIGFAQLLIGLHVFPIVIREASISAIVRSCRSFCSAHASCSALASSWIRSCSLRYSSFASWKTLMDSMSCCKARASLPLDPNRPCLVFLIMSEGSVTNVDGIKYYRAARRRQMFSLVDLGRIGWASSSLLLSPFGAPRCRSTGTKWVLRVDHTPTIKLVRAYKINIQCQSQVFRNSIPLLGVSTPFIDIPSTVFSNLNRVRFQQGEYNLKRKHIIIIEKHIAYMLLYLRVLNNNKTFCSHVPLSSGANHYIPNNFYLYLISIYNITNLNIPSI